MLWLDADTWVADWSAVELLVRGALGGSVAMVSDEPDASEHPAMRWLFGRIPLMKTSAYKRAKRARLPISVVRALATKKKMNGGVFALRGDAPHWATVQAHMVRLVKRGRIFGSNQLAFLMAVHLDGLALEPLPRWCNFTGLPRICATTGRLVEPTLPHAPLGIMHLAGRDAMRADPAVTVELKTTDGLVVRESLRFQRKFLGATG